MTISYKTNSNVPYFVFSSYFSKLFFIFFFLFLITACAPYKIPTKDFLDQTSPKPEKEPLFTENKQKALNHWLYQIVPRNRCQIKQYDLGHWCSWALFGNDDDGLFGEETFYQPTLKNNFPKAIRWGFRNPLHNFCYYTIGSAHRVNSELAILKIACNNFEIMRYRRQGGTVFGSKSSSFLCALHGGKPYLAIRLVYTPNWRGMFYIGWRERGNFGFKFQPLSKKRKKKPKSICQIHSK